VFTSASFGLAASSSPRYRCRPSPCTGLSPARSTTAAPPRSWPTGRRRTRPGPHAGRARAGQARGGSRVHCDSLARGGARLCPSGLAASTPQAFPTASRSPVPRLPESSLPPCRRQVRAAPGPDPPGSSRYSVEGRYDTSSSRTPLQPARQAHAIWQYWPALALSGLLPPSPAPPGTGCPQLLPGRCDGPAVVAFHLHSNQQRLTAHEARAERFRHHLR
jgi:hypothetical protein